jgi:phosphatidylglycerophosphatase C
MSKRLVLLDFDGTLTTKDTLLVFIRFYHGNLKFLIGFAVLSPVLIAMKLKLIRNDDAKQVVLRWFFGGTPLASFNSSCAEFAKTFIPGMIKPSAEVLLTNETARGSRLIVVSASPENWVRPWCDSHNIECLATQLEVVDQKISGKIQGANCYGAEKVSRILKTVRPDQFDKILAYGDSRGDKEMLELAHEPHYRSL